MIADVRGQPLPAVEACRRRGAKFPAPALSGSCTREPPPVRPRSSTSPRSPSSRRSSSSPGRRWAHQTSASSSRASCGSRSASSAVTCARTRMAKRGRARAVPDEVGPDGPRGSATAFSIEVGRRRDADRHAAAPTGRSASCGAAGGSGRRGRRRRARGRLRARCGFEAGADGAVARRGSRARAAGSSRTGPRPIASSSTRVRNTFDERRVPAGVALARGRHRVSGRGRDRRRPQRREHAATSSAPRAPRPRRSAAASRATARSPSTRVTLDGASSRWPMMPTIGTGKRDWIVEYTFDRDGAARARVPPRRARRTAASELTETVARLDLRDPANLAAARAVARRALPWPPNALAAGARR